jgi:acyl carrier protein
VGAVAGPIVVSSRPRRPGLLRPALGRPLAGAEAYVLDRALRLAPPGVPGELFLGGEGVARGYLGQPDRTAERFVPHPFASRPGARLYRTGDLARRLPDGTLEFLGRADAQVKIRGFRVEPGEVEAALARHPEVRDCAVVVRQTPGGPALAASVVLRDEPLEIDALRGWLAERLPPALVPAGWAVLEALPLTANGKVDRQALLAMAPDAWQGGRGEAGAVPPRTSLEREIAAVWCEVLGVEKVGVGESFFDLGGHSLLLPRVQLGLRERLGLELPLIEMFAHPTVGALAAHLERGESDEEGGDDSRERVRRQRQGLEMQRQRLARRRTT